MCRPGTGSPRDPGCRRSVGGEKGISGKRNLQEHNLCFPAFPSSAKIPGMELRVRKSHPELWDGWKKIFEDIESSYSKATRVPKCHIHREIPPGMGIPPHPCPGQINPVLRNPFHEGFFSQIQPKVPFFWTWSSMIDFVFPMELDFPIWTRIQVGSTPNLAPKVGIVAVPIPHGYSRDSKSHVWDVTQPNPKLGPS